MNHFAIVTVVRNDLAGLKKSRISLNKQTFKNWTHIIIDGDSQDGTKEYLEKLPKKNTIFVSEKDSGIYSAMNKGWALASNDSYVFFLNARDTFADSTSLEQADYALSREPEKKWGCTTHEEINEDGSGWCCKLISEPTIQNQLYAFGYRSHQAVVMRKSLINQLNGFNEEYKLAADWDLIVRAIQVEKPAEWSFPLGRFELGGVSSQRIMEAHRELIKLRAEYTPKNPIFRIYEEIWRLIFLQNFGYRNVLTRSYGLILKAPIKLKRLLGHVRLKPQLKSKTWVLLGLRITISRNNPKKPQKIKEMRRKRFRGLRNIAIEKGIFIFLNRKLRLEPYRAPHLSNISEI